MILLSFNLVTLTFDLFFRMSCRYAEVAILFHSLAKEQESLVRYLLMPFSFGPRMCIGNRLAMAEMRLVLAYLLQKFIFSPVPGFPEVKPKMSLTAKPFPSLQLRIRAVEPDA